MKSIKKLVQTFKLYVVDCNKWAQWMGYLLYRAVHNVRAGHHSRVIIYFWEFPVISSWPCCYVVCFRNASTLLESWFIIIHSLFLKLPTWLSIILIKCNHHLINKHKFTRITRNNLHVHFWRTILVTLHTILKTMQIREKNWYIPISTNQALQMLYSV